MVLRFFKNKRGHLLTDMIVFMVVAFFLVVFAGAMIFVSVSTYSGLSSNVDVIQNAVGDNANATVILDESMGVVRTAYTSLNWVTFAIIFSMVLSILITSFLVRTNPVFFVPYLIVLFIDVIVSVPISNTYEILSNNAQISSAFTGLMSLNWIMLYLPVWVTVVGLIAGVLMFVNVVRSDGF